MDPIDENLVHARIMDHDIFLFGYSSIYNTLKAQKKKAFNVKLI